MSAIRAPRPSSCTPPTGPHWDFDLPSQIYDLPFLDEQTKRKILGENACRLFNLEVPGYQRGSGVASPAG